MTKYKYYILALVLTILGCTTNNKYMIPLKKHKGKDINNQNDLLSRRNDHQIPDYLMGNEDYKQDEKEKQPDNEQYLSNIQPQAQAMEFANYINEGLENGDRALVLKGLQLLGNIDMNKISNPRIVMEKILDAITGKALQWENYGLKRHIAKQLRRFVHRMYKISKTQKKRSSQK